MRHLLSLLAGVVVAPLAWGLIALGQSGSQDQIGDWVNTKTFDTADLIEPAIYLVVAGILLGLIATLRISPLGPLVGGLLLVAAYVGMFIAPLDVRDAIPDDWTIQDRHLALRVPLDNGTLALVGLLLVMAVFSANRWRHWPAVAAAEPGAVPGAVLSGTEEAPALAVEPIIELPTEPTTESVAPPETLVPEPVSVGAKSTTESGKEKSTPATSTPVTSTPVTSTPAPSKATTSKATRGKKKRDGAVGEPPPPGDSQTPSESPAPSGSPWSAPPGQSQPEKS